MKCNPVTDIPDGQYVEHVNVVHNGKPQAKMTPLDPNLPPDAEFQETWAEIQKFEAEEKAKKAQQPPPAPQLAQPVISTEKKPVELTYKYVGQAEDGHSVETLELDVADKHFVIAFDPVEKTQVESREVADLKPQKHYSPSSRAEEVLSPGAKKEPEIDSLNPILDIEEAKAEKPKKK